MAQSVTHVYITIANTLENLDSLVLEIYSRSQILLTPKGFEPQDSCM